MVRKFKKGAASFYIVAFSTLILMIIAMSFAAIIISVVTRTSNEDLSQSAYDSALAGIEDAKLAYHNYRNCKEQNASKKEPSAGEQLNCGNIVWYMEEGNSDCDMVSHILGRLKQDESQEVLIQESTTSLNNMMQAYTCVKIQTELSDYRSTLSATNQVKVAKIKFDKPEVAKNVKKVKISWYSDADDTDFIYSNFSGSGVIFPKSGVSIKFATPPTIAVTMLQTAETFTLSDFDTTRGDRTNRGTLYFVPTGDADGAAATQKNMNSDQREKANYRAGAREVDGDGGKKIENFVGTSGFLGSNDKLGDRNKNLPYAVYCPRNTGKDFACEVTVELPKPVGGERSNETFAFVLALPYGKPTTDFALEFYCNENVVCGQETVVSENDAGEIVEEEQTTDRATLSGSQIEIDSTGRANDLYRRVQVRLEGAGDYPLSMMGALELIGDESSKALEKNYTVKCEWNFPKTC